MATLVRNTDPVLACVCTAHNQLKAQIGAGSSFHLDASEVAVSAANASSLATSLALAKQLRTVYLFHLADTLAHKVVDTPPALSEPTDLATAITFANALKADYNTHRASTTYHHNADSTNAVSSSDASDQASLNTLLNEIKTDLAAHIASAPSAPSLRLVSP